VFIAIIALIMCGGRPIMWTRQLAMRPRQQVGPRRFENWLLAVAQVRV
jgi:hypothetical protein